MKEDRGKEGYMGKGRLLEGSRTVWGKELKHELNLLIMVKYALFFPTSLLPVCIGIYYPPKISGLYPTADGLHNNPPNRRSLLPLLHSLLSGLSPRFCEGGGG